VIGFFGIHCDAVAKSGRGGFTILLLQTMV
jgi:hypothetical protein